MKTHTKVGLFCIGIALIALIYIDYTTNIISERWRILLHGESVSLETPQEPWLQPTSAPIVYLEATPARYIVLPMQEFIQHHVVLFLYPVGDTMIRFFVIKEGIKEKTKYRAVADACELCFMNNQGFEYKDSYFVCRDCGMSYHSQRVGIASGGCNPIPLPLVYINDRLEISKDALAKVAKMF
ncbi:MAG: DUF2318 domain-containing protein [Desulfovibrionaceae bacterium]|nr:DUF2318 domain-containing protein [Desulfovibrionaceae bacterium]